MVERINRTIEIGQREQFKFTILKPNSKSPPIFKAWQEPQNQVFPDNELLSHWKNGYNIAVIANENYVIDTDRGRDYQFLKDLDNIITITPKGANIYLK